MALPETITLDVPNLLTAAGVVVAILAALSRLVLPALRTDKPRLQMRQWRRQERKPSSRRRR